MPPRGVDQKAQAQAEADDDGPEQPDVARVLELRKQHEHDCERDDPQHEPEEHDLAVVGLDRRRVGTPLGVFDEDAHGFS